MAIPQLSSAIQMRVTYLIRILWRYGDRVPSRHPNQGVYRSLYSRSKPTKAAHPTNIHKPDK